MNKFHTLIEKVDWIDLGKDGLRILFVIIACLIILKIKKKLLQRLQIHLTNKSSQEGEPPTESAKRIETLIKIANQSTGVVIISISLLIVLKELGIDIGPIIASVGVVSLALGFGAQNLVRDFISGFFMILENQIRVGDVAIINGTGGLVEEINLRTTILRDLGGVVHVFPNGAITSTSNLTNEWSAYVFDIGVAYKENTDKVIEVMGEVGKQLFAEEHFNRIMLKEPEIFGVDNFGDSAVMIKGRIETKPIRQWEVGREYLRRIKLAFDENGIEIPFPHRTMYFPETLKIEQLLNQK